MAGGTLYWVAFRTILIKEMLRFLRIWVQTILPPAITMALYFVIFGKLIGTQIGDMEGFRYIDFIVPGLILILLELIYQIAHTKQPPDPGDLQQARNIAAFLEISASDQPSRYRSRRASRWLSGKVSMACAS